MSTLQGKVALVTGGARGIGRAIVENLSADGAAVVFTYRSSTSAAEQLVSTLKDRGSNVNALLSDAASMKEAADAVDSVVRQHGRLDILVNNAGITRDGLLMRMSEEDWNAVLDTNLRSVFNFTKAA